MTAPEDLTVQNQIDNNARNANNTPVDMKLRSRFHVPHTFWLLYDSLGNTPTHEKIAPNIKQLLAIMLLRRNIKNCAGIFYNCLKNDLD